MKKTVILLFGMMLGLSVQAQGIIPSLSDEDWDSIFSDSLNDESEDTIDIEGIEPKEVQLSIEKDYDFSYYRTQSLVWKRQTELRPHDPKAWFNYYRYTRYMLRLSDISYEESDSILSGIIRKMQKAVPDTYEYYNLAMGYDFAGDSEELAKKAIEKMPANMTLYDYDTWVSHYYMRQDTAIYVPLAKQYFNSGLYSKELLQYSLNELDGMKDNAIYVGNGDASVIPKWLIIDGMNKHKDKIVICYSFLGLPNYCQRIYSSLGIGEVPKQDSEETDFYYYNDYCQTILQTIVDRTGRELYFSKENADFCYTKWKDNLYDEGLVYHYSPKPIDKLKAKKHNFEKVYDLDYLLKPMEKNEWTSAERFSLIVVNNLGDLLDYYKKEDEKNYNRLYSLLKNAINRVEPSNFDERYLLYLNSILDGEEE